MSLVKRLGQTDALGPTRRARSQRARVAAANALAPAEAALALNVYRARATQYIERAERLIEKHGSDFVALDVALASFPVRGAARRAGRLAQSHARRELSRALGVPVKPSKEGDLAVLQAFVAEQERLFRRLATDVAARAVEDRKAAVKLARARARLISSDQVFKVASEATAYYALANGADRYIWHTRSDEKVRSGHAKLHLTTQSWASPPNTGRQEGFNHPGAAVHCRCLAVPVRPAPQS